MEGRGGHRGRKTADDRTHPSGDPASVAMEALCRDPCISIGEISLFGMKHSEA